MPLTPAFAIPTSKWSKFLVRIGEEAAYLLLNDLVDQNGKVSTPGDLEWRRVVLRFTRPPISGAVEDEAQIKFDLVNITGGDVDTSWTAGDYTTAEGALDEWWTAVKPVVATTYQLKEYRWYKMAFAEPMQPERRFAQSGPPQRVTSKASPGTSASGPLPQQVAASITLKTPAPRHWGRVYMPGLTVDRVQTSSAPGRWVLATQTVLANATAELVDDLGAAELFPVVPVTQVDGSLAGALLGVTSVQVDDIPDVIRRRRAKTTLVRTLGVPTA